MPLGLKHYQHESEDHFLTFCYYGREPHLGTPHAKDTFLFSLELIWQSYGFEMLGYVVMPEHVHLLAGQTQAGGESGGLGVVTLPALSSERTRTRPHYETIEDGLRYRATAPIWR